MLEGLPYGHGVDWWVLEMMVFEMLMGYRAYDYDTAEIMGGGGGGGDEEEIEDDGDDEEEEDDDDEEDGDGGGDDDDENLLKKILGTLAVANLDLLWLINHRLYRSPVHLGLNMEEDLLQLSRHPRRVADTYEAQVSDSSQLEALRRTGGLRGPNRLGSLAMPELPRRATR
jgi:hypothetical protein